MNLVLFTKSIGSPMTLRMGHTRFYIITLCIIITSCGALFYGGWWLRDATIAAEAKIVPNPNEVAADDSKASMNEKYLAELEQYAQHIGLIKAEITRINALGHKVATLASLHDDFDFINPPAQGGPARPANQSLLLTHSIKQNILDQDINKMSKVLNDRRSKLTALLTILSHADLQQQVQPEGKPVRKGKRTSPFGVRIHPITGRRRHHDGVDYAAPRNTPIYAVAAGVVTYSGRRGGYGNLVEVNHGGGLITRYAHNNRNLVGLGDQVQKHEKIALVGSTGRSTGNHVHFEVSRDGKTVNPVKYIRTTYSNQNPLFNNKARQVTSKKPSTNTPIINKQLLKRAPKKLAAPATPRNTPRNPKSTIAKDAKKPALKAMPTPLSIAPNEIKAKSEDRF